MIEVSFENLPAMTAEAAQILTGVDAVKFNRPGIFHVLIGSRGEIEEFEFIGEVKSVKLPTLEEVIERQIAEWALPEDHPGYDPKEADDIRAQVEEFYGIGIEDDHINFGYTEEGYDVWVRI